MRDWPNEIMQRRFKPREVAALTGVSPAQQRLWASRHFDFRESVGPEGAGRSWTWQGVQTLTVFSEAMLDLRDADRATAIARGSDASPRTLSYDIDLREADEDNLIVYHYGDGPLAGDGNGTAKGLAGLYGAGNTASRPGRIYAYNLSDMQRRLCAKMGID